LTVSRSLTKQFCAEFILHWALLRKTLPPSSFPKKAAACQFRIFASAGRNLCVVAAFLHQPAEGESTGACIVNPKPCNISSSQAPYPVFRCSRANRAVPVFGL
jgi:hypothetical protein